jgi:hypothetical protein
MLDQFCQQYHSMKDARVALTADGSGLAALCANNQTLFAWDRRDDGSLPDASAATIPIWQGSPTAWLFQDDRYSRLLARPNHECMTPAPLSALGLPWERLDAALSGGDGRVFFFCGNECVAWEVASRQLAGSVRKIVEEFPGLWDGPIDAACHWTNEEAFFFKGNQVIRYNLPERRVDPAYPRGIATIFQGKVEPDVEAALDYTEADQSAWIIQRGKCVQVGLGDDCPSRPLREVFPNLEFDRIDAAVDAHYRYASRYFQEPGGLVVKAPDHLALSRDGSSVWATAASAELHSFKFPELSPQSRWSGQSTASVYGSATLTCLAAGKDWIAAGTSYKGAVLFDSATHKPVKTWLCGEQPACVAIAGDESVLVCGTANGNVLIGTIPECQEVAKLSGHADLVTSVAFGPRDVLLASGSHDRTVRLWHRRSGIWSPALTLQAPGLVSNVRFSHDGRQLFALVKGESALRVWRINRLQERLKELNLNW